MNHQVVESEEPLSLSADIKRACELLEKLQKSKYCGEVPATKLAALQKVLQSDFLTAVREVYEHIYETVDIEGKMVSLHCEPCVPTNLFIVRIPRYQSLSYSQGHCCSLRSLRRSCSP